MLESMSEQSQRDNLQTEQLKINIGIFGCVSVGKSTLLNALFGKQYSDIKLKRTTMVPQVYQEIDNNQFPQEATMIRDSNRVHNEQILSHLEEHKEFTIDECRPLYYQVNRIFDLFDDQILNPNIRVNFYDIPGLNDVIGNEVYMEWVKENIHLFDILIFMTDITKGLNTSDERNILSMLTESMTKNKSSRMICLMNKCDDIYFDHEQDDVVFEDDEQAELFVQANNLLNDLIKQNHLGTRVTPFIPISCENCFIYRTLISDPTFVLDKGHQNKLGRIEYAPNVWKKMSEQEKSDAIQKVIQEMPQTYENNIADSGYLTLRDAIRCLVRDNQTEFVMYHIDHEMTNIMVNKIDDISYYLGLVKKHVSKLKNLEDVFLKAFGSGQANNSPITLGYVQDIYTSYHSFWQKIKVTVRNYVSDSVRSCARFYESIDLMNFNEFTSIHAKLQDSVISLNRFIDETSDIKEYPVDFMTEQKKILIGKIVEMYKHIIRFWKQCYCVSFEDYLDPSNIHSYLTFIHAYATEEFDFFWGEFLNMFHTDKTHRISLYDFKTSTDLYSLISYIGTQIPVNKIDAFNSILFKILFFKIGKEENINSNGTTEPDVSTFIKKITYFVCLRDCIEKRTPFLNAIMLKILLTTIDNNLNVLICKRISEFSISSVIDSVINLPTQDNSNLISFEKNILDIIYTNKLRTMPVFNLE
jgi:small GTP-binding protein